MIAFLVNNPDKQEKIENLLNTEGIQTEFNKRLYEYFISRIKKSLDPLAKVSADFTGDEVSKRYRIVNSYQNSVSTEDAMREYINIINEESQKISKEDISKASSRELLDYIQTLKDKRK